MLFQDVRVQDIQTVFRFSSRSNKFGANRNSHILGIKLSGRSVHRFVDRTQVLEPGQLYFFNQKDSFVAEMLESGSSFSVHFTTTAPIAQDSFFAAMEDSSGVVACMEQLERSYLSGGCGPAALSDLYRIFSLVAALVQLPENHPNRRVEQAREYLNLHFREKGCIDGAAGQCGVTARRFTDLFFERYHITPNRYLIQVKLEKAKQLLAVAELSLAQVAELSGFSDVYYFSKVFKREMGLSPGEYRKKA